MLKFAVFGVFWIVSQTSGQYQSQPTYRATYDLSDPCLRSYRQPQPCQHVPYNQVYYQTPNPAPQPAPQPCLPAPHPAPYQPAPYPVPQPAPSPVPQPGPSPNPQQGPYPVPQPGPYPVPLPGPSPVQQMVPYPPAPFVLAPQPFDRPIVPIPVPVFYNSQDWKNPVINNGRRSEDEVDNNEQPDTTNLPNTPPKRRHNLDNLRIRQPKHDPNDNTNQNPQQAPEQNPSDNNYEQDIPSPSRSGRRMFSGMVSGMPVVSGPSNGGWFTNIGSAAGNLADSILM